LKSEKRTDREVSQVKLKSQVQAKVASCTLVIAFVDVMTWLHEQLNSWVTSRSIALSQTLSPRCGMGPGHVRLWSVHVRLWSVLVCSIFTFT